MSVVSDIDCEIQLGECLLQTMYKELSMHRDEYKDK